MSESIFRKLENLFSLKDLAITFRWQQKFGNQVIDCNPKVKSLNQGWAIVLACELHCGHGSQLKGRTF